MDILQTSEIIPQFRVLLPTAQQADLSAVKGDWLHHQIPTDR